MRSPRLRPEEDLTPRRSTARRGTKFPPGRQRLVGGRLGVHWTVAPSPTHIVRLRQQSLQNPPQTVPPVPGPTPPLLRRPGQNQADRRAHRSGRHGRQRPRQGRRAVVGQATPEPQPKPGALHTRARRGSRSSGPLGSHRAPAPRHRGPRSRWPPRPGGSAPRAPPPPCERGDRREAALRRAAHDSPGPTRHSRLHRVRSASPARGASRSAKRTRQPRRRRARARPQCQKPGRIELKKDLGRAPFRSGA